MIVTIMYPNYFKRINIKRSPQIWKPIPTALSVNCEYYKNAFDVRNNYVPKSFQKDEYSNFDFRLFIN